MSLLFMAVTYGLQMLNLSSFLYKQAFAVQWEAVLIFLEHIFSFSSQSYTLKDPLAWLNGYTSFQASNLFGVQGILFFFFL